MGFPLLLNKALKCGQETWIWAFYKWHSFEEGIFQSGQVGVPLLLNKALKWGQDKWIWAFYKLHSFEEGMFRVGNWAFPCC